MCFSIPVDFLTALINEAALEIQQGIPYNDPYRTARTS